VLILTVIRGIDRGKRFELPDAEPQMIGRSSESLPLSDKTISRCHAELTPDDGRWYIRDLGSANGTFVNAVRVEGRRLLQPGDQIRVGSSLLLFGKEAAEVRQHGVKVAKRGELEALVEATSPANDDSMIMAVPEPSEAAVVQLRVIYELTQLIGSTTHKEELLEKVMDLIFKNFEADRGFVLLMQGPNSRPDPVVIRHRVPPAENDKEQILISRTIVHHVINRGEGVLSSNAMNDERFATGDSVQQLGIRSALCVPIKYKDEIFGVINLDSQIVNYTFTEDQLRLLTAIGVHTGLALANAQLYTEQLNRERLAAVGQTVASLSHSIRNILQAMRGGADVVELGLKKDNVTLVKSGWDIVSRNLDRIYGLTLNMLAFSKQRKPELDMTNLNHLLEEIAELVQQQYDNRKIALILDLAADMPPVPLDQGGIHQAVLNLLRNALDAVEPETGAVTLSSQYDDEDELVIIRVVDNGVGISEENQRMLFQPFHSTKGLEGTGLGLSVTKKIVDDHGGQIDVDSNPNEGTTFTITLPTQTGEPSRSAETQGPG